MCKLSRLYRNALDLVEKVSEYLTSAEGMARLVAFTKDSVCLRQLSTDFLGSDIITPFTTSARSLHTFAVEFNAALTSLDAVLQSPGWGSLFGAIQEAQSHLAPVTTVMGFLSPFTDILHQEISIPWYVLLQVADTHLPSLYKCPFLFMLTYCCSHLLQVQPANHERTFGVSFTSFDLQQFFKMPCIAILYCISTHRLHVDYVPFFSERQDVVKTWTTLHIWLRKFEVSLQCV